MHVRELRREIDRILRIPLGACPTPLHPAPSFSEHAGVEVWIKRDELSDRPGLPRQAVTCSRRTGSTVGRTRRVLAHGRRTGGVLGRTDTDEVGRVRRAQSARRLR